MKIFSKYKDLIQINVKYAFISCMTIFFLCMIVISIPVSNSIDNSLQSVVYIEVTAIDGRIRKGSGFFIDDDKIITNSHVVSNAQDIRFSTYNSVQRYRLTPYINNKNLDVAILTVAKDDLALFQKNNSTVFVNKIKDIRPKIGQEIYVIGHPFNYQWSISRGIISGDRRFLNLTQIDAVVAPGNSGGPVFDKYDQVLGMISSRLVEEGSIGFFIRNNTLQKVVDDYSKYNKLFLPYIGFDFDFENETGSLIITDVYEDITVPIQKNDKIYGFKTDRIQSSNYLNEYQFFGDFMFVKEGEEFTLLIERDGKKIEVTSKIFKNALDKTDN